MAEVLIAYYLLWVVYWQSWPMVLGPYNFEECQAVLVAMYDKNISGCTVLPLPQDSIRYFPQETAWDVND